MTTDTADTEAIADRSRNVATIWETIAAHDPGAPALICGDTTRSWGDFEERAARLAGAFAAAGLGEGSKVAHFLFNGNEYLETSFAAMKLRGVHVNVNYRYLEDELSYLLDNSDAEAVVFSESLADRVTAVVDRCPKVKAWVQVGSGSAPDGCASYEDLISSSEPLPSCDRSKSDLWFLYTGGTTGMPKGVMWPHDSLVGAGAASLRPFGVEPPSSPDEVRQVVDTVRSASGGVRLLAAAPLMHGTSGISSILTLNGGGAVVTVPGSGLDAKALLTAIAAHRVTNLTIVGDVFARPLIDAMREAQAAGEPFDTSSLTTVVSSGVMWSAETKTELLELVPNALLVDTLGSSEGVGFGGSVSSKAGASKTAKFTLGENTRVFTDDGREVQAGSGEVGVLAVGGPIPAGYYKDEKKSAETFPEIAGRRWSMPGDFATIEEDGSITLLGRGSVSINSGGEKIFPEEVEEALKTHEAVADCNVVGLPDDKWGQRVVAVVSPFPGGSLDADELIAYTKTKIAPYKAPKQVFIVDKVVRGPNGKADYKWAGSLAQEQAELAEA